MSTSPRPGGRSRVRGCTTDDTNRSGLTLADLRQALSEFLAVPISIVVGLVLLAAGISLLDRLAGQGENVLGRAHDFLRQLVFDNPQGTSDLLAVVAGSLITLASITMSLLLLALQQSASSLTAQVYDQFLRRRINQAMFGFFVGAAVFSLVTLATVNPPLNPVFGATVSLFLAVVALCVLVFLIYATINQMRPNEVTRAIHGHALKAREKQHGFISRTRRSETFPGSVRLPVHVRSNGYLIRVDIDLIAKVAAELVGEAEVVLKVPIGAYITFDDVVAEVKAQSEGEAKQVVEAVADGLCLARIRDISEDPAGAVEQLTAMGWTSISTALSNAAQGTLVVFSLRDLLARWSTEKIEVADDVVPVVYHDDLLEVLMDALESLAVVASESMQHQNAAEIIQSIAIVFDRLPILQQQRAEGLLLRLLSGLGDHILTRQLEAALVLLERQLHDHGFQSTAAASAIARLQLGSSIGDLNSRSTRVPSQL